MFQLTKSAQQSDGRARGSSPILVTAALSMAALIATTGFRAGSLLYAETPEAAPIEPVQPRTYVAIDDSDGNGTPDWQDELERAGVSFVEASTTEASSSDPLSTFGAQIASALYGGYLSLKQTGDYSSARAENLAGTIADNFRAPDTFVPHTVEELTLDSDISAERALTYRSDMREATAPLITDEPPELDLFAQYLLSKDASWLMKLADAAARYRVAEEQVRAVSVPKDATPEHLRALNALGAYATTLERLSHFGTDALSSVALIKSLNENEQEMLYAFDALAKYYVRTIN